MQSIIMLVTGLLTALFGFFGVQLNLASNVSTAGVVGGILLIAAWLFATKLQDLKDLWNGVQIQGKWGDASFWASLIAAVMLPISTTYGLQLSSATIGIIATILSIVVPILISIFHKTEPVTPTTLAARKRGSYLAFVR